MFRARSVRFDIGPDGGWRATLVHSGAGLRLNARPPQAGAMCTVHTASRPFHRPLFGASYSFKGWLKLQQTITLFDHKVDYCAYCVLIRLFERSADPSRTVPASTGNSP
jgi:hypothetical protein